MVTHFVMSTDSGILHIDTHTLKVLPKQGEYVQLKNGSIHKVLGVVHCVGKGTTVDVYLYQYATSVEEQF